MGLLFFGSKIAARSKKGDIKGSAYVAPAPTDEEAAGAISKSTSVKMRENFEKKAAGEEVEDEGGTTDWESLLFNNLLLFSFVILPSISTKIIHTFACEELNDDDMAVTYPSDVAVEEHGLTGAIYAPGGEDPLNLNEGSFLKADYNVRCTNPYYEASYGWALIMIFVFPLGIPIFYFTLLWNQRHLLDPGQDALMNTMNVKIPVEGEGKDGDHEYLWPSKDENGNFKPISKDIMDDAIHKRNGIMVCLDEDEAMHCALWMRKQLEKDHPELKRLKFLYDAYECTCWWFEVFETWRKLALTSGLIFFGPGTATQIVISMILCLGSMRVYSGYKPYIRLADDHLAEAAQWQMFFTMLGALMLKVDITRETPALQDSFGTLIAAMQGILPLFLVYQMVMKKGKKGDGDEEAHNPLTDFFDDVASKVGDVVPDDVMDQVGGAMEDVKGALDDAKEAVGDVVGEDAMAIAGKGMEAVEKVVTKMVNDTVKFVNDTISKVKGVFEKR
jgi:uncharacterized protein YjbJ (UPF0337 family)